LRRALFVVALLAAVLGSFAPPAAAQTSAPHVVASANGATARSSADEGEIQECRPSGGCTVGITAPARPPASWDGELPVSGRSVVEVTFARPVELVGASMVDREFKRLAATAVEKVDDQHWRVVLPALTAPDRFALQLHETWTGETERGRYTVYRTDYIGAAAPAGLLGLTQRRRGGGPVADLDVRAPGLVDARLQFVRKTLGRKSSNFAAPRRLNLSVPLSPGARRLLAQRRRLVATLTVTVRPPSGDPVVIERQVALRAKPR
jgi:hypothetical protein